MTAVRRTKALARKRKPAEHLDETVFDYIRNILTAPLAARPARKFSLQRLVRCDYLEELLIARGYKAFASQSQIQLRSMLREVLEWDGELRTPQLPSEPLGRQLSWLLAAHEKVGSGGARRPTTVFDAGAYDVSAINGSEDPVELANVLSRWQPNGRTGLSLLLYGPPGTGKSEYVHFLAKRMGRPVIHRSASDILRAFLGETEQQIAAAFERAERDGAVLLFDEIDSFLRARRNARHSWEVTEVNEFLQRLDAYTGVVAGTTNLYGELDLAALRRFSIKMEFFHLSPEQAWRMFVTTFSGLLAAPLTARGEETVRSALGQTHIFTPGDFAIVARRLAALGQVASIDRLLELLSEEVRARPTQARRIGFIR